MLPHSSFQRTYQIVQHLSRASFPIQARTMTTETNGSQWPGVSLSSLPKSNVFTSNLPSDKEFPTPQISHKAMRNQLGPRIVKDALYTYVRPENSEEPQVLGISKRAMRDIGLMEGEEKTEEFKQLVSGNKIYWDEESGDGIYPWAQCYGGTRPRSGRKFFEIKS